MEQETPQIEDLGYPSWLACYDDMVHDGLQDEAAVELTYPDRDSVTLDMDHIKARAFDEIFPLLPPADAMQVMLDVIEADTNIGQRQLLLEFLNKIPTRAQ